MKPVLYLALAAILAAAGGLSLRAEDWTTSDGKVYQQVTVIKAEPDAVTIVYRDGGALLSLAKLSPDLQKRFNYDPLKAQTAADARAEADAKNAQALQLETERAKKLRQAAKEEQKAQQQAASARIKAASGSSAAFDFGVAFSNPKDYVYGDVQGHLKNDPIHHYNIYNILDPSQPGIPSAPVIAGHAAVAPVQTATFPQAPSIDPNAAKIRLIGKVRAIVAGGYVLGSLSGKEGDTIKPNPARPDPAFVNNGDTVFLATSNTTHNENEILDIDAYHVGMYTDVSGATMPGFTTSASSARAYLSFKQDK